jgi:hypothetical protein
MKKEKLFIIKDFGTAPNSCPLQEMLIGSLGYRKTHNA